MIELESTTFFIDRCLGKTHIVETLQAANIRVEIHDNHFGNNAPDMDWIPEIGRRGWIVLTKDANIGKNQLERLTVADANVRMFVLASQSLSGADMADILLQAIPEMREFIRNNSSPFIAKIYRSGKVKTWKDNLDLLTELSKFLEQS